MFHWWSGEKNRFPQTKKQVAHATPSEYRADDHFHSFDCYWTTRRFISTTQVATLVAKPLKSSTCSSCTSPLLHRQMSRHRGDSTESIKSPNRWGLAILLSESQNKVEDNFAVPPGAGEKSFFSPNRSEAKRTTCQWSPWQRLKDAICQKKNKREAASWLTKCWAA